MIILLWMFDPVQGKSLKENGGKCQSHNTNSLYPICLRSDSSDVETELKLRSWMSSFLKLNICNTSSSIQRRGPLHLGNPKSACN